MATKKKAPAKKKTKRAHEEDGTFTADDPSTPEVNEAFEAPPKRVIPRNRSN